MFFLFISTFQVVREIVFPARIVDTQQKFKNFTTVFIEISHLFGPLNS